MGGWGLRARGSGGGRDQTLTLWSRERWGGGQRRPGTAGGETTGEWEGGAQPCVTPSARPPHRQPQVIWAAILAHQTPPLVSANWLGDEHVTQSSPIRALQCRCLTVLAGAIRHFPAAFCMGGGNVWPASLSLPSGFLLGLADGKAQQETGGEVPPVRVLIPCWLHWWFPVVGHSPPRQHLLGSVLTHLWARAAAALYATLGTYAITCSSLTHCVSTHTGSVLNPP